LRAWLEVAGITEGDERGRARPNQRDIGLYSG
jgi:hypothetical protein